MHNHGHHHHHHTLQTENIGRTFTLAILINVIYVVVEMTVGFIYDSVGLISDAGHNLSDVASLILALTAYKLSKVNSNAKYTYGYKKTTILVSLINACALCVIVFFIFFESIEKIITPGKIQGGVISITAAVGVLINGFTAWLFVKGKKRDLNIKGAYLHMLADALVSIGVVVSGLIISYTGVYLIDGIIGIIVGIVIIVSTWDLLQKSLRLILDGVPEGINPIEIAEMIKRTAGVKDVHHVHIWAISTNENAMTAHVVLEDVSDMEKVKHRVKHLLAEHCNISHSTLEFETSQCDCAECNVLVKD